MTERKPLDCFQGSFSGQSGLDDPKVTVNAIPVPSLISQSMKDPLDATSRSSHQTIGQTLKPIEIPSQPILSTNQRDINPNSLSSKNHLTSETQISKLDALNLRSRAGKNSKGGASSPPAADLCNSNEKDKRSSYRILTSYDMELISRMWKEGFKTHSVARVMQSTLRTIQRIYKELNDTGGSSISSKTSSLLSSNDISTTSSSFAALKGVSQNDQDGVNFPLSSHKQTAVNTSLKSSKKNSKRAATELSTSYITPPFTPGNGTEGTDGLSDDSNDSPSSSTFSTSSTPNYQNGMVSGSSINTTVTPGSTLGSLAATSSQQSGGSSISLENISSFGQLGSNLLNSGFNGLNGLNGLTNLNVSSLASLGGLNGFLSASTSSSNSTGMSNFSTLNALNTLSGLNSIPSLQNTLAGLSNLNNIHNLQNLRNLNNLHLSGINGLGNLNNLNGLNLSNLSQLSAGVNGLNGLSNLNNLSNLGGLGVLLNNLGTLGSSSDLSLVLQQLSDLQGATATGAAMKAAALLQSLALNTVSNEQHGTLGGTSVHTAPASGARLTSDSSLNSADTIQSYSMNNSSSSSDGNSLSNSTSSASTSALTNSASNALSALSCLNSFPPADLAKLKMLLDRGISHSNTSSSSVSFLSTSSSTTEKDMTTHNQSNKRQKTEQRLQQQPSLSMPSDSQSGTPSHAIESTGSGSSTQHPTFSLQVQTQGEFQNTEVQFHPQSLSGTPHAQYHLAPSQHNPPQPQPLLLSQPQSQQLQHHQHLISHPRQPKLSQPSSTNALHTLTAPISFPSSHESQIGSNTLAFDDRGIQFARSFQHPPNSITGTLESANMTALPTSLNVLASPALLPSQQFPSLSLDRVRDLNHTHEQRHVHELGHGLGLDRDRNNEHTHDHNHGHDHGHDQHDYSYNSFPYYSPSPFQILGTNETYNDLNVGTGSNNVNAMNIID